MLISWAAFEQGRVKTHPPVVVIRTPIRVAVQAAIEAYAKTDHMLDAAMAYAERGFPIFPLSYNKKPIPARDKDAAGKPIPGTGGFKKATTDPSIIRNWWKGNEYLIGLPTGPRSGVWVLDVDTPEDHADDGVTAWSALTAEHGAIKTREHRTASNGLHLVFNWHASNPIRCGRGSIPNGMEVKGDGGYIVVPPSHRKGRNYHVTIDVDPVDAPAWLIDIIGAKKVRQANRTTRTRRRDGKKERDAGEAKTGASIDLPELALIAEAMSYIPNPDLPWDGWTKLGLALWAATNGQGLAIFDTWSQKSSKYDPRRTWERWQEITESPPNWIGADYIFELARAHGWLPKAVPTYPSSTFSDLDAARAELRRIIREFLTQDQQPQNAFQSFAQTLGITPPPLVKAARVDTGVGKTRITIEEIASSGKRGIVYAVPTHKLGGEIEQQLARNGVSARVFRGRAADDPDHPGAKMCLNLRAVDLAMNLRADISETCCKHKGRYCNFFDQCGYQRQKAGTTPDVWIVASDLLFHHQEAFGEPLLLIIDEAIWQKGLRGIERAVEMPLAKLGNGSKARGRLVYALLGQTEDGGLQRKHIEEMSIDGLSEMIKSEWDAMPRVRLRPGMNATEITRLENDVRTINQILHARFVIDILEELRWMVRNPQIGTSGRLLLDYSGGEVIRWRSIAKIGKQFEIPTLLLDATLPDLAILQVLHPEAEIAADINVALPNCVQVRQVLGAPTSARKLIANSHLKDRERHLRAVRRYILQRWMETGKQPSLVICQQEVEEWLDDKLPDDVAIAHYNAIAGLDEFRDVRLLILVGRTQPGPEAVEAIAGALSGAEPKKAAVDPQTGFRWYDRIQRGIRLPDGTGIAVDGDKHPDPFAESVRLQITEGELVQAVGRARAVNRTDRTPLDVDLLFNTCLPVVVDEVSRWGEPSLLLETAAEGVILTSPVDMVRIWPNLWPNTRAAKRTLARGVPALPGFEKLTYQLKGPKLKTRIAYFNLGLIADPRRWLEQRLGPLTNLSP